MSKIVAMGMNREVFEVIGSTKVACFVAGFGGKISQFKKLIHDLNDEGYSVVAYQYDTSLLSEGNPKNMPKLIDAISADFSGYVKDYEDIVCCGASLGAYIAFNVQSNLDKPATGLYTSAGVPISYCIFHALVFRIIRHKYIKNGYSEESLRKLWDKYEILSNGFQYKKLPMVVALGAKDKITDYKVALKALRDWQDHGQPVVIKTKKFLGHSGTIRWYKNNIKTMLDLAKVL